MKTCKDCKHSKVNNGIYFCQSPMNGLSPVTGRPLVKFAAANRRETSVLETKTCGPDGDWWEKKPPEPIHVKTPWWNFWSKN